MVKKHSKRRNNKSKRKYSKKRVSYKSNKRRYSKKKQKGGGDNDDDDPILEMTREAMERNKRNVGVKEIEGIDDLIDLVNAGLGHSELLRKAIMRDREIRISSLGTINDNFAGHETRIEALENKYLELSTMISKFTPLLTAMEKAQAERGAPPPLPSPPPVTEPPPTEEQARDRSLQEVYDDSGDLHPSQRPVKVFRDHREALGV